VIWIQLGIGLWLLVAKRGLMSRLGAVASIAWALSIWSVGTGFGAIFASGSSLLFGSPGSSLFYAVASALLVVPTASWSSERFTSRSVKALGVFFVAMGILQAWPGRGTWSGFDRHHQPAGQIVGMATDMASTPQPHAVSSLVSSFATLAGNAPVLVNACFVVLMVVTGVGLLVASKRSLRVALVAGLVFSAVTWIFVEDLGFFGGVGTDLNTMPILALLLVGLVQGVTHRPVEAAGGAQAREGLGGLVAIVFGSVSALVVLLGAIPMAQASVSTSVDPLLAQAINTPPQTVHFAGLPFTLTDQRGRTVTNMALKGKVVALTFLDPVCVSDCPTIAREMSATDALLGPDAKRVALVAISANPTYRSVAVSQAFTEENGLSATSNWFFLTGDLPQLQRLWAFYDVQTSNSPAGAMTSHNDITYLIDAHGTVRLVFASTPGDTGILHASFSAFLAEQLRNLW
jgi:cytochrome oxidase Cu insertion factor (SCO1/SenC/PrrC family)